MTLEDRLRAAAADAFPPTPDLAAAWSTKPVIETGFVDRRRRWRPLMLVLAALLAPAAAIGAVELLGTDHVRIERVPTLPTPATAIPDEFGERVGSVDEASERAGFNVETPAELGEPDDIRVAGTVVTLFYDEVAITEAPTRKNEPDLLLKTVGPDTDVERVRVGDATGFFLTGAPHSIAYVPRSGGFEELEPRLAGTTLVFERDGLVIRIEGEGLTKRRAFALARATAPPPSPAP